MAGTVRRGSLIMVCHSLSDMEDWGTRSMVGRNCGTRHKEMWDKAQGNYAILTLRRSYSVRPLYLVLEHASIFIFV